MLVAAIQNGTVIDHIPSEKAYQVAQLLKLAQLDTPVTIGYNFRSKKLGRKGIIKVEDKFFTDEEISRLSVVAPNQQRAHEDLFPCPKRHPHLPLLRKRARHQQSRTRLRPSTTEQHTIELKKISANYLVVSQKSCTFAAALRIHGREYIVHIKSNFINYKQNF